MQSLVSELTLPAITTAEFTAELTLPQLRLLAAFVGARLANFVSSALKSRYPNLKVKLWSDSEIVLHWLCSNKQLKLFIGNRTGEIKSLFPLSAWNHCPTNENPAHLLTRGTNTTQLHSSALWTHGPYWLPFESQAILESLTSLTHRLFQRR